MKARYMRRIPDPFTIIFSGWNGVTAIDLESLNLVDRPVPNGPLADKPRR